MEIDQKVIDETIKQKVQNDGLKFSEEFCGWSLRADAKLREYLFTRPHNWCLNENTLHDLSAHFNNEHKESLLRTKCWEYGVEYDIHFMNEEEKDYEDSDYEVSHYESDDVDLFEEK